MERFGSDFLLGERRRHLPHLACPFQRIISKLVDDRFYYPLESGVRTTVSRSALNTVHDRFTPSTIGADAGTSRMKMVGELEGGQGQSTVCVGFVRRVCLPIGGANAKKETCCKDTG